MSTNNKQNQQQNNNMKVVRSGKGVTVSQNLKGFGSSSFAVKVIPNNDKFRFIDLTEDIFNSFITANSRLSVGYDKIYDLLLFCDYVNGLDPVKTLISVGDDEQYKLSDYEIPEFLNGFFAPKWVSFDGTETFPDLVNRWETSNPGFDPNYIKSITIGLCKYLRVQTATLTRPENVKFLDIKANEMMLGRTYPVDDMDTKYVWRYALKPDLMSCDVLWTNEQYMTNGISRIRKAAIKACNLAIEGKQTEQVKDPSTGIS